MNIQSLQIKGFRNLAPLNLVFNESEKIVAFVGPNGHGKTNILEAIFVTAISKSFRSRKFEESIGFNQDFCSTKTNIALNGDQKDLEVIMMRTPLKKGLKINGVQKNAVDYIGQMNVVFFSPDDMTMIHSAPGSRRRYLDLLLSQFDRDYLNISLRYQQLLKQRNALLKSISEGVSKDSELGFWNEQLAEVGLRMMIKRQEMIEDLSDRTAKIYHEVSGKRDKLKIRYLPSIKKAESVNDYLLILANEKEKDVLLGYTQQGPHRDDLLFLCNGKNMASYASRGEWRSLILTLKFAEIYFLKEKTNEWPILLLDDVFSELDDARQRYLFNELKEVQTFITTTHEEFLEVINSPLKVFKVSEGEVSE